MSDLIIGGRAILLDFASTILFLGLYLIFGNLPVSLALGVALALGQIGWRLWRREPVDALQWISLVAVLGSSAATLVTHDPRFLMVKPSIIYLLIAAAMLRRGWMTRYMPVRALEYVPDLVIKSGYFWAGLMAVTAVLNLVLTASCSALQWALLMSAWGVASKSVLFFAQFAVMKSVGKRRARGMTTTEYRSALPLNRCAA